MIYSDFLDDAELRRYAQTINGRAQRLGIAQRVTLVALRDCIYDSGGICGWCATNLVGQPFEIDHLIGLSKQGSNQALNLVVTCPTCNRRKAAKHPATFAQESAARTGIITPLIKRVLDYYQIDIIIQRSLFDQDTSEPAEPSATPEDDTGDIPPYIWNT